MSTPAKRPSLAPRLVIFAGVLLLFVQNLIHNAPEVKAAMQIGGGVVALAGLVWFLLTLRRR